MDKELIERFRARAKFLRIQGYSILFIIVLLLFSGAWIFFNAGEITRSDVKLDKSLSSTQGIQDRIVVISNELDKLKAKPQVLLEYESKAKELNEREEELNEELESIGRTIPVEIDRRISEGLIGNVPGYVRVFEILKINVPESVEDVSNWNISLHEPRIESNHYLEVMDLLKSDDKWGKLYREKVNEFTVLSKAAEKLKQENSIATKAYIESLDDEKIGSLENELEELYYGIEIVKERELKEKFGEKNGTTSDYSNISTAFLVQTNITRFGPLFLVLFFVGILVNLYRYNIRLSGHYDARADGLELLTIGIDGDLYEQLVSSVSPEQYDFGKTPASPAEHAVELAKTIAAKSK